MSDLRKRMYTNQSEIKVQPTTRGYTVVALFVNYDTNKPRHTIKKWTGIKEGNVADHTTTDLKWAFAQALVWLDEEMP